MLELVVQLHGECDQYSARIMKRFLEARKVKQTVQEIALYKNREKGDHSQLRSTR